jgi:hypothetical protein
MKRTSAILGGPLLLIAIAPYAYVQFRLRSHNWFPLKAPVKLVEGEDVASPEFKADLTGSYEVGMDFAPINVDFEECLAGDSLFKDSCKSVGSGLVLDWSVVRRHLPQDVMVVDHEAYKPQSFGGAGVIEAVLGSFDAQEGEQYKILLHIRKIAPELNSASPKINVEAHRIYWEKWIILAQASLLFAVLPGISGLLVLLRAIFKQRKAAELA